MIHLPNTAAARTARVPDPGTEAGRIVAAVREPPPLSIPLRTPAPDPGPPAGITPRGAASGFFRDPGAFRALAGLVPTLFEGKGPDEAVRVWVAGCATGEEAWSIAILLAEHADTLPHPPSWELFATDTDATGCARGRDALYPASAVAGLPHERLKRFFVWEGGGYRVARALRGTVLFARHDVLRDPPFDRLDLVSCRGLLSALPAEEQARVMDTFHEALRPGGVLFLGTGESPASGAGFAPAAGEHHVYLRDDEPPRPADADAPGGETPAPDGSAA
jgi:two-component system CheB/CheR fusion protein